MEKITFRRPSLREFIAMKSDGQHAEFAYRGHLIELNSLEWDLEAIARLAERKRADGLHGDDIDDCRHRISSIGYHYSSHTFALLSQDEQAEVMSRIVDFGIVDIEAAPVRDVLRKFARYDDTDGVFVNSFDVHRPSDLSGQIGSFTYVDAVLPEVYSMSFLAFNAPTEHDPLGLLAHSAFCLRLTRTPVTEVRTYESSVDLIGVTASLRGLYQRRREGRYRYIDCTLSTDIDAHYVVTLGPSRPTRHFESHHLVRLALMEDE